MSGRRKGRGGATVKAKPSSAQLQPAASSQRRESKSEISVKRTAFSAWNLWICLALIALNVFIYASVWHYEFIDYDDPAYVPKNPAVAGGLTLQAVKWAFTSGSTGNWFPLTWMSHMLDVQIYGMNAGGHHLTNALLHIASTLLLFELFCRMTGALGRSAFVAALFAVHPLHVGSVAWVAERKDVLSTLFWMLTIWAYVGYTKQPRLGRYCCVLGLFALGLMSKPMVVTLPFVLLLLDIWPLRRVWPPAGPLYRDELSPSTAQPSTWFRLSLEKLPLLILAVASSIVTLSVQQQAGAVAGLDKFPLGHRVMNALVSYVVYIRKMLWPARLAPFYPSARSLVGWWVAGAIFVLAAISVAVIRGARQRPYLAVGWLWYLGTLLPVIGLIQVGTQAMADRYTYVPLIGLFLIAAWGAPELLSGLGCRTIVLPAAGLVILACALTARSQVKYWHDSTTLWRHALEVTEGNYLAHNNLGVSLADQGELDEAVSHYLEALRSKPDYVLAHNNLGIALAAQGKLEAAIAHYREALRFQSDYVGAATNLGNALEVQGKHEEAIAQYSAALRLQPDFVLAHSGAASALEAEGKHEEAIAEYSAALRLKPDFPEGHNNLGAILAKQGKVDEAIREFSEALRFKPNYADAKNNLAAMLQAKGQQPPTPAGGGG